MKTKINHLSTVIACLMLTGILFFSCSKDEDLNPLIQNEGQTLDFKAGGLTYQLIKVTNPTADQLDAYSKITTAMNAAVAMYNNQTSVSKAVTVYYVPSVPTADANINGTIRFGANRGYMTQCTAMHEIAHTLGVGTSAKYKSLIVNGKFTGANALAMLRSMVGESSASVLYGDSQHFWPYGLNYNSEWSTVNGQRNARIVGAMKKDGI